jgi:N-acetylmuramoyl-L-alanine amidase
MPSILVETGFITYKPDQDYLNSEKGQQQIADNILAAVKKYRQATEGR